MTISSRVTSLAQRIAAEIKLRSFATGDVKLTAVATAPGGWLIADGSAVSRTTYAALFAAIGTTYGAGDGSTTFLLPDLRTRVPVGRYSGDTTFGTLGAMGGEQAHALSVAELASHGHGITDPGHGHAITDNGHSHNFNHGHSIWDNGHSHNFNHGHGIWDNGHTHGGSTSSAGAHTHGGPGNGFWYSGTAASNIASGSSTNRTVGGQTDSAGSHTHSFTTGSGGGNHGVYDFNGNTGGGGGNHGVNDFNGNTGGSGTGISINGNGTGITVQGTGSGTPHNVMQPYVVLNYLIKT